MVFYRPVLLLDAEVKPGQPIFTNPADVNGYWQFTDTNLNTGQKYYRAVGQ